MRPAGGSFSTLEPPRAAVPSNPRGPTRPVRRGFHRQRPQRFRCGPPRSAKLRRYCAQNRLTGSGHSPTVSHSARTRGTREDLAGFIRRLRAELGERSRTCGCRSCTGIANGSMPTSRSAVTSTTRRSVAPGHTGSSTSRSWATFPSAPGHSAKRARRPTTSQVRQGPRSHRRYWPSPIRSRQGSQPPRAVITGRTAAETIDGPRRTWVEGLVRLALAR